MAEYKLCSWEYFLDRMALYELDIMLDCLDNSVKQQWEQSRYICYTTIQSQSTKKLKPEDIMSFKWDKVEEKNTTVTKEEKERLTEKAKKIMIEKNKINNNGSE